MDLLCFGVQTTRSTCLRFFAVAQEEREALGEEGPPAKRPRLASPAQPVAVSGS